MIAETIIERMAKSIRYVKAVPYASATGLTAQTYQQMQDDFLPVPLLTLHSPVPEIMAGVWSILRESLLAGHVDRITKEAVAATVSRINECPFCVDAHTLMIHATDDHDLASTILRGDYDYIPDPQIRALVGWALANRTPDAEELQSPPFSRADAPEIIGTALTFHYINRMVNLFLGDTLLPLPSVLKGVTGRLLSAAAGKRFVIKRPSGDSLKLIPEAPLPDDLAWASPNPAVARAFAGFASVIEAQGRAVLPEPVRLLVSQQVSQWNGETMSISRRWVEDAITGVNQEHQPAARLTLLTTFAPYQVDSGVIADFRTQYPEDAHLIAAAAWASWTGARRVSSWLHVPEHDYQAR